MGGRPAAAILTGAYISQVLLTFSGKSAEASDEVPTDYPDDDTPTTTVCTSTTATPTVGYGVPPRTPALHQAPRREGTHGDAVVLLAGLSIVGGLLNVPLKGMERPTSGSSRCSPTRTPDRAAVVPWRGGLSVLAVVSA